MGPKEVIQVCLCWKKIEDKAAAIRQYVGATFAGLLTAAQIAELGVKMERQLQKQSMTVQFVLTPTAASVRSVEIVFFKPGDQTIRLASRLCRLDVEVSKLATTRTTRDGVLRQSSSTRQALNSFESKQVVEFIASEFTRMKQFLDIKPLSHTPPDDAIEQYSSSTHTLTIPNPPRILSRQPPPPKRIARPPPIKLHKHKPVTKK